MKRTILLLLIYLAVFYSERINGQPTGGGPQPPPPLPTVIYVKKGATGSANGTTWANAYPELSTALAAATSISGFKEIWVARGEYKPTYNLDRTISFNLLPNTFLYGGFVGTETTLDERNWKTNRTVLSGDLGELFDNSDNSHHVISSIDAGENCGINGFIVRGGNTEGSLDYVLGGGLLVLSVSTPSSPQIINCEFSDNYASAGGGIAVHSEGAVASPEIIHCTFRSNNAVFGGGVSNSGDESELSKPRYVSCTFYVNTGLVGRVVFENYAESIFLNCSFTKNLGNPASSTFYHAWASSKIYNSILWDNNSGNQIQGDLSNLVVQSNIIQGGYGVPSDNNINADPLFVREPSPSGVYPRTSIIPVSTTEPWYENMLSFNGPKLSGPWPYYTFMDHEYNKMYLVGSRLQVLDFSNLVNNFPTSTIYNSVTFPRTQRLERSIHTASNRIFFSSFYAGLVSLDRATGQLVSHDVLSGEPVTFTNHGPNDLVVDNENNLLYAPIFYNPGQSFYGLLELNLTTQTKRWITTTSSPVNITTPVSIRDDGTYWGGLKLYLDEEENVLYFSTGHGVWWWNRGTNQTGVINTEGGINLTAGSQNLPSNLATSMFMDHVENKFYIGTHAGLFVWDRNNNTSRVYNTGNSELIHDLINHIDKNEEKKLIYVACEEGGLFILNTQTGEERLISEHSGSEVYPLYMDNSAASAHYDEVDKKLYVSADHWSGGVWIMDYNNLVPDYGDLRLQAGSPALDRGDENVLPPSITTDINGVNRLVDYLTINGGNKLDLGAYEREYNAEDDQPATEETESPLAHNYILSYSPQVEIVDESSLENAVVESVNRSIQYFDGLGRPDQSISIQGSPDKRDIVQPIVYDVFGREAEKYLPYVAQGLNGSFKVDAVGKESQNYLASPHGQFYETGEKIAHDSYPYASTVFEKSPLSRVIEQGAPGSPWQPTSLEGDYLSTDRTVKFAYESNEPNEVLLWTYAYPDEDNPFGSLSASSGVAAVYYGEGELYRNRTKDEHHKEVIEYKDKEGRVILKKVQAPDGEWAETYYVYDDFGNLVVVLPPEAVKQMDTLFIQD